MRRGILALVVFALLASGCQRVEGPNVVLVTLDAVNPDRLGVGGDSEASTPTLDDLASRGVWFERAYADVPITLPSHASILTGRFPHEHGVRADFRFALAPEQDTVAERFAELGYDTAAFVSASALDSRYGLAQGFGHYDDDVATVEGRLSIDSTRRPSQQVTDAAIAWIEDSGRAPFFVWVHYDVQSHREPPPPYDALDDRYAGVLAHLDTEIRRLLEAAGAGPETLVVVAGSHAAAFGRHNESQFGTLAYDSTLHVPLIAAGPGLPAGVRSDAFVRSVDVAPTLLAAAGAADAAGAPFGSGVALSERLAAGAEDETLGYFETYEPYYQLGWSAIRGVRDRRWKLTAEPDPIALYDVIEDPGETNNLAAQQPEVVARLSEAFDAVRDARGPEPSLPEETRQKVQELAGDGAPAGASRADPRTFAALLPFVGEARRVASRGRVAEGLDMLELLTEHPVIRVAAVQNITAVARAAEQRDLAIRSAARWALVTSDIEARIGLALALLEANRPEEVFPILAGVEDPSRRVPLLTGQALLAAGRVDEALQQGESLLAEDPGSDAALALVSRARVARDGAEGEIDRLERLLRETPHSERLVQTRSALVEVLIQEGRYADAGRVLGDSVRAPARDKARLAAVADANGRRDLALKLYLQALRDRPADPTYRFHVADLYLRTGRLDEALALYNAMVAADPEDASLYLDRGVVYARGGDMEKARGDFEKALALDDSKGETHYNLALIARQEGRMEDAERLLLRAVELSDDIPQAHLLLAGIYNERGDPRAERHAELAVGAEEIGPIPSDAKSPQSPSVSAP